MFKTSNCSYQHVDLLLRSYEVAAERAASSGVDLVSQNYPDNWDYLQAVFFSTTILTTIGTLSGRICRAKDTFQIFHDRNI